MGSFNFGLQSSRPGHGPAGKLHFTGMAQPPGLTGMQFFRTFVNFKPFMEVSAVMGVAPVISLEKQEN